jgi:ribosomal protein L14E/L6E/L27E
MKKSTPKVLALSLATLILLSSSAFAQYVWLNDKGVKQFSDKPPPASVPRSKIIKAPNFNHVKPASNTSEDTNLNAGKEKLSEIEKLEKPKTIASKNEDFNKRKQEREAAEKKAQEEQQLQAENKKQCERAQSYQRSLEGGVIISSTNKNGERVILDAAQRAKELADTKKTTSECK